MVLAAHVVDLYHVSRKVSGMNEDKFKISCLWSNSDEPTIKNPRQKFIREVEE